MWCLLIAVVAADSLPSTEALEGLARQALVEAIPARHESTKDWGKTSGRFDFKHQGGLRFERRVKEVNHGLWKKYAVSPIEPKEKLDVRLTNVVKKPDGTVTFTAAVQAPLAAEATVQSWSYGVKLLGLTIAADATAVATIDVEAKFATRWKGFAPEFVCVPTVLDVRVGLHDFKLRKLGSLSQRLARELEDEAAKLVRKQIEKREPGLVEKANAALRKKRPNGEFAWSPLDGVLR